MHRDNASDPETPILELCVCCAGKRLGAGKEPVQRSLPDGIDRLTGPLNFKKFASTGDTRRQFGEYYNLC